MADILHRIRLLLPLFNSTLKANSTEKEIRFPTSLSPLLLQRAPFPPIHFRLDFLSRSSQADDVDGL